MRISILLLLSLVAACFAAEQTNEVVMSLNVVNGLVNVSGDSNFPALLTNYTYRGNLTISWAVPEDALKGVEADEAIVYVSMKPRNDDSHVTFRWRGRNYSSVAFTLRCSINEGRCSGGSHLNETVEALVRLNEPKSLDEVILVEASTMPLGGMEESLGDREAMLETIKEAKKNENTLEGITLLEDAEERADALDIEGAREKYNESLQLKSGNTLTSLVAKNLRMDALVSSLQGVDIGIPIWAALAILALLAVYLFAKVIRVV